MNMNNKHREREKAEFAYHYTKSPNIKYTTIRYTYTHLSTLHFQQKEKKVFCMKHSELGLKQSAIVAIQPSFRIEHTVTPRVVLFFY